MTSAVICTYVTTENKRDIFEQLEHIYMTPHQDTLQKIIVEDLNDQVEREES